MLSVVNSSKKKKKRVHCQPCESSSGQCREWPPKCSVATHTYGQLSTLNENVRSGALALEQIYFLHGRGHDYIIGVGGRKGSGAIFAMHVISLASLNPIQQLSGKFPLPPSSHPLSPLCSPRPFPPFLAAVRTETMLRRNVTRQVGAMSRGGVGPTNIRLASSSASSSSSSSSSPRSRFLTTAAIIAGGGGLLLFGSSKLFAEDRTYQKAVLGDVRPHPLWTPPTRAQMIAALKVSSGKSLRPQASRIQQDNSALQKPQRESGSSAPSPAAKNDAGDERVMRDGDEDGDGFDLLIVGGGATGAGVAVDAATRGLSVAMVEKDDFGAGESTLYMRTRRDM